MSRKTDSGALHPPHVHSTGPGATNSDDWWIRALETLTEDWRNRARTREPSVRDRLEGCADDVELLVKRRIRGA